MPAVIGIYFKIPLLSLNLTKLVEFCPISQIGGHGPRLIKF